MSYTYLSFQKALALEMIVPNANTADPNFVAILPTIIDYAEQRCYRELDIEDARGFWYVQSPEPPYHALDLSTVSPDSTVQPPPLIVERLLCYLPAGVAFPPDPTTITGVQPCVPVSGEYLEAVYGYGDTPGPPRFFAPQGNGVVELGPWPDQPYAMGVIGKYRPFPLYSAPPGDGTQSTFLSSVLPDLFLAAAMISAAGYQKNFGAMADDPRMAMSWETQFQTLLSSAKQEEMRKKFHGWQANTAETTPAQTPQPVPGG